MYLALSIAFLILSIGLISAIIFIMVRSNKNSGELISKKNLFFLAPSVILLYFMYMTAAVFNGEELTFLYCFSLGNTVLDTFKFKISVSFLSPICKAMPLFYADIILAYIATATATVLSVASFFSQRIRNYFKVNRLLRKSCDIVLGYSDDSLKYLKNNSNCILLEEKTSRDRYADLLKNNIPVINAKLNSKIFLYKLAKKEHHIIVFKDSGSVYTKVIDNFAQLTKQGANAFLHIEAEHNVMKFIKETFISQEEVKVGARISCFSKYELIARNFVYEHPITKYIPRGFYNENFTLKRDKQINIVFVGFGKFNYPLFRMCSTQFQFAQMDDTNKKLEVKPVNYYVFDNDEKSLNNEYFSRIDYEFDKDFENCDFEKPPKICNLSHQNLDINSTEAKRLFKSLVSADSYTYFIVSLSDDLEDAAYAQTIKRLIDNETNYKIFVRTRNNSGEKLKLYDDNVCYFGNEKQIFDHQSIVNDDLTVLAQTINLLYHNITNQQDNRELMREMWFDLPVIQQSSNLYHALNYQFKLHLMGYGMVKHSDNKGAAVTEKQFNERYINSGRDNGYSDYSFFFNTESSNVLAFIEHSRWNALYILNDYKQMRAKDIKADDQGNVAHKDTAKKLHACITTYYGLDKLIKHKYRAVNDKADVNKLDYKHDELLKKLAQIYAYDYMDLDKLYQEITSLGYDIVDCIKQ